MRSHAPMLTASFLLICLAQLFVWPLRPASAADKMIDPKSWQYPDAKVRSQSGAGVLYSSGVFTKDSPEKVAEYYRKKLGLESRFNLRDEAGYEVKNGDTHTTITTGSAAGEDDTKDRTVTIAVLSQVAPTHFITVVINRAEGEAYTSILLSFAQR